MNKKLLSAAIGAVLAGSMAAAQADVQLYGQMDVSIDSHDCTNSTTGKCLGHTLFQGFQTGDGSQKVNMAGNFSYFGIKGSEDLGNGLKAIFNVAFAYDPSGHQDSGYGSNGLSDNQKWLGVSGDFGTLRAGTVFTPYSDHGESIDPFYGTALEANKAGLQSYGLHDEFSHSELATANGGFGALVNKTLRYDSPEMNGLSGSLFYTFGGYSNGGVNSNTDSSGNKHNPYGIGGQYKNGNILAFVDYMTSAEGGNISPGDDKVWDLGGRYTMGNIGLFGMYERGGLIFSWTDPTGPDASSSSNQWHLGGDYTMGNTMLYAAYGRGNRHDANGSASDSDSTAWTVGVKHSLSQRTFVYAGYNRIQGHDGENRGGSDLGQTNQFSLGMNLKF